MNRRKGLCTAGGFSLVELMIVIVVIGVLSAIAFPSYTKYAMRGKRSAAENLVMEIASKEQQYILDARQYTNEIGNSGLNIPSRDGWTCATTCTNSYYTVSVAADNSATPPSFTITAAAQGSQAADGNISYGSTGAKSRIVGGVDQGW